MVEETKKMLNQTFSNNDDLNIENKTEKEDDVMIFNKEEFAKTFSMTANEMWELISNTLYEVKYQDGDYSYCKYWMRDYDNTYVYAYDEELNKLCAIPYSISEGKVMCDFENTKNAKLTYIVTDEDSENLMEFAEKIMSKKMTEFAKQKETMEKEMSDMKEKMSAFECEKEEMVKKCSTLETEKTELTEKFSTLETRNAELESFKADIESQEKQNKIEFAIESVKEDLTQEQIDEWREKSKEFSKIEEFTNAIKAFAYEVSNSKKNPERNHLTG
jgi:predicted RNase H-like nuclease (RuvC/YqgF family)